MCPKHTTVIFSLAGPFRSIIFNEVMIFVMKQLLKLIDSVILWCNKNMSDWSRYRPSEFLNKNLLLQARLLCAIYSKLS